MAGWRLDGRVGLSACGLKAAYNSHFTISLCAGARRVHSFMAWRRRTLQLMHCYLAEANRLQRLLMNGWFSFDDGATAGLGGAIGALRASPRNIAGSENARRLFSCCLRTSSTAAAFSDMYGFCSLELTR